MTHIGAHVKLKCGLREQAAVLRFSDQQIVPFTNVRDEYRITGFKVTKSLQDTSW